MNYRHSFHAGNFADVMKHALLARVLLHLCAKDTPFRVIDTHAGSGRYNLGSDDAARTGEWHEGIGRLMALAIPAEIEALLAPYFSCAKPLLAEKPPRYPGSPAIVQALTRRQDRLSFIELHQHDFRKLQGVLAGDRRAKALCRRRGIEPREPVPARTGRPERPRAPQDGTRPPLSTRRGGPRAPARRST